MAFLKVKCFGFMFLLCLMEFPSAAQRTACGGRMISTEALYPLGASLSYGQYLPSSFWETGVNALWRDYSISGSYAMRYIPLTAYGNWLFRLVATRSRSVNLYAGAGAFLGWEFYDPAKKLPDFISGSIPDGTFIYGVNAKIQLQVFLSRRLSILLSALSPFNFSSPCTWIQPCVCFGLRLDL